MPALGALAMREPAVADESRTGEQVKRKAVGRKSPSG